MNAIRNRNGSTFFVELTHCSSFMLKVFLHFDGLPFNVAMWMKWGLQQLTGFKKAKQKELVLFKMKVHI